MGHHKEHNLKHKVISGLVWTFGERILAQGVSFIVSIILARILMPEEYGAVSLILVFITLANVFVSDGFGEALVQKKDSDETDFSTVFYCSFAFSWIIYLILFITAPYIAEFYRSPILTSLLRVLALKIPISSISTIQHAYVSKHMIFKKFFFSTLGGTVVSGIAGIIMAYNGFGAWSLVAQYLTNTLIDTIVLSFTVPWRPRFVFSSSAAKQLIGYSWKLTASSFINQLYCELKSLVIGRKYTSSDLAYFNRGNQFPSLIITNIDTAIGKVVFPAMTKVADDKEHLKAVSRRALKTTSYIIFPLMAGLFVTAEPLVKLLLTDKWLFCVPYLQCGCVYYMCQPIQTTNWQIIKACGRSDLCLKLELVKKTIGIVILFATMSISVKAIAWGNVWVAIISMVINIIPNKKLIGYSILEQILDLLPSLLLSSVMAIVVFLVAQISISTALSLILQMLVGAFFYIGSSKIFRLDSYDYLLSSVNHIIRSKKHNEE